ncbi:hypothetical protein GCM10007315_10520 [Gemmobacter tilapiae]|uniref:Glycosyltransferase family 2 protein n=1 Tax=Neogemmobacter tilapiae TaxID=875041 RepID=A0A918TI14_9RHOB|nr:hypothetical protein GCM10007315_10520 [Gemmobacter tilapiae]
MRLVAGDPASIDRLDILVFCTLRNEIARLPGFLAHHRALGVRRFLIVDNASTDGSADFLADQGDVILWRAEASYRLARFGMDWINHLLARYGQGHWCLTLDADERLVYPYWQTRPLSALTEWLESQGREAFGAMMLDLYPKGPLSAGGGLEWFDAGNYVIQRKPGLNCLWLQGGPRARAFFADKPRQAPTLTKIPLVRWHWRYAYHNATHSLLPPRLNAVYDKGELTSGLLLHDKFRPLVLDKSAEEKFRRAHFGRPEDFDPYYDSLIADPELWHPHSTRLTGSWRQLEALGLMSRGGWV